MTPAQTAQHWVTSTRDHLMLGPTVERDGESYFIICGHDGDRLWVERVETDEGGRSLLAGEVVVTARGLIVHTFEDELDMATWCAAVWPSDEAKGLVNMIEAERAVKH